MPSAHVVRRWWGPRLEPPPPEEEQLASRLVAGVLHEVNTPLGAMSSTASTLRALCLRMQADALPQQRQDLELLLRLATVQAETARRLGATMRALERFVDLDRSELRSVDLAESLNAVIAMLGETPAIEVDVDAPHIVTRARALHRVLLHLLEQALEAGGSPGPVRVKIRAVAGRQVRITVSDGGRGLDEDGLGRRFEPHLTPAEDRVRLELDGATTLRTVRALGGELTADSGDEQGTTITIVLPLDGALP